MSIFNKISLKKPSSSTFNLSHDRKFSLNMGDLVPILCQEVVPGDIFNVTTKQMLRFAPMLAPVMHEVNVFTHFFFVPNRLVSNLWEEFITGGENADGGLPLTMTNYDCQPGTIGDYLGLPFNNQLPQINRMPLEAYNLIYDEYYRDQNLIDRTVSPSNPNTPNIDFSQLNTAGKDNYTVLKKRAWQHDYFTSALPFAQKGDAVQLPIQGQANVFYEADGTPDQVRYTNGNPASQPQDRHMLTNTFGKQMIDQGEGSPNILTSVDNASKLKVDLETATQSTITDLRRAFKLQEWLEKNARAGTRYVESILSHFNVLSSDRRLQRPEYLGGGMSPVLISEVLQTAPTTNSTPLGEMAGHGINVNKNHSFKKFFEEHGFIIGIMSVMPKTAYQQGIPRMFTKDNRFDYFWPEFQHIGEQEILNKELFVANSPVDEETFGYIPRYAEYKYIPSTVHGDFKTNLDFWHMGRIFDDTPALNKDFITANPTKRIFAVETPDEQALWCHMYHDIKATRKMTYYGDPGFR